MTEQIVIIYLLAINVIAFMMMRTDKGYAKHRKRRIPESRLLGVAAIGGALGAWLAMSMYRHKTKHARFSKGIPFMLFIHVVIIAAVYYCKNTK